MSELNFPTKLKRRTKATFTIVTCCAIYTKETQLLAYANDIEIIGKSQPAVRDANLALKIEATKLGLKINEHKTKYMIAVIERFMTWGKVW
jgi:hypothetical protein